MRHAGAEWRHDVSAICTLCHRSLIQGDVDELTIETWAPQKNWKAAAKTLKTIPIKNNIEFKAFLTAEFSAKTAKRNNWTMTDLPVPRKWTAFCAFWSRASRGQPSDGALAPLYDLAVLQSRGVHTSLGSACVSTETFAMQPCRLCRITCVTFQTTNHRCKKQKCRPSADIVAAVPPSYTLHTNYHSCPKNVLVNFGRFS